MFHWLRAGRSGFGIPAGANNSLFSEIVQTGSGAHLTSYLIGTGGLARGQNGRGVKLTNDFHLARRLRMRGAIHLLHHYAFMAGTGTTFTFASYVAYICELHSGVGPWPFMPLVSSYVNARSLSCQHLRRRQNNFLHICRKKSDAFVSGCTCMVHSLRTEFHSI